MQSTIVALVLAFCIAPSLTFAAQPDQTMTVFVRLGEVIKHSGDPTKAETEKYKSDLAQQRGFLQYPREDVSEGCAIPTAFGRARHHMPGFGR